jgi:hypothetical protein
MPLMVPLVKLGLPSTAADDLRATIDGGREGVLRGRERVCRARFTAPVPVPVVGKGFSSVSLSILPLSPPLALAPAVAEYGDDDGDGDSSGGGEARSRNPPFTTLTGQGPPPYRDSNSSPSSRGIA